MRPPWSRAPRPPAVPDAVLTAAGVRRRDLMAAAPSEAGWLLATRTELVVLDTRDGGSHVRARHGWEHLDLADWDADTAHLTLVPSDPSDEVTVLSLDGVDELLRVVRERLSATLVLERHARLDDHQITAVCRRRAVDGTLLWRVRYSEGIDADDPAVRRAAARLLRRAQDEVGAPADPTTAV